MNYFIRMSLAAVAVFGILIFGGCGKGKSTAEKMNIDIKGSDTMVNLMSNEAEAYMKIHPEQAVAVTGGGSGTGIAALLNGTTDICAASRAMKQSEIDKGAQTNVYPVELKVGLDGIAVMLNPNNPIDSLTTADLKGIYTGQITNWNQLGGPDQNIVVLSRENSSGTYVYFQEHVLEKADYTASARLMTSTSAIVQEVSSNVAAIGYGGVAYAMSNGVKSCKVKSTADAPAIAPSEATVADGTYPISRPLFLYTNGAPAGHVQEFIHFMMSPEGQKIVLDTGYIPIKM